jgi:uncharacterized NAD-dependent epimerase/dehydratase family protein
MSIPALSVIKQLNEMMASIMQPCQVIGISMNGRLVSAQEAKREQKKVHSEFGIPVCDVFRDGPEMLVDAVLELKAQTTKP